MRYVGEPVAVVFADNPYQAEDAAEQIVLEIEALAPVLSTDDAPGEFEEGLTTEPMVIEKAYGDIAGADARRPRDRRTRSFDRAAFGRAAGDARRDRAPRCRA